MNFQCDWKYLATEMKWNQFIIYDDCSNDGTRDEHQMFSVRIMSFKCWRVCRFVFLTWHDKREKCERRKAKQREKTNTLYWKESIFQKESVFGVFWTTLIGDLKSSSLILKCLLCFGYRFIFAFVWLPTVYFLFGRCLTLFLNSSNAKCNLTHENRCRSAIAKIVQQQNVRAKPIPALENIHTDLSIVARLLL